MKIDMVVKAVKNQYGVTKGYTFTSNSDFGHKYLTEHWSIRDEVVNPVATEFFLKHMAENGLKADLRY
jgi:hypothetical protein